MLRKAQRPELVDPRGMAAGIGTAFDHAWWASPQPARSYINGGGGLFPSPSITGLNRTRLVPPAQAYSDLPLTRRGGRDVISFPSLEDYQHDA
jgi:hypothetical protein